MKLKSIFKPLSPYGVEQQYIENEQEVPEGWTEVWPPQPCWKPVYDRSNHVWIEIATDEEMNPPEVPTPPTELEKLRTETDELKKRVSELETAVTELLGKKDK